MEIKAPDGTTIYRGTGKETKDFTVNIQEKGVYVVVVVARHAKGKDSYSVCAEKTIIEFWNIDI